MGFDLDPNYNDVAARIVEFRAKHPEGSLRPLNPAEPYKIEQMGDRLFIVVVAAAYRTPDDTAPGVGMAYEQFPGRTPYTRDSELQNAETAAWGRAIIAVGAADAKKGIASAEEVRNRQAERDTPQRPQAVPNPGQQGQQRRPQQQNQQRPNRQQPPEGGPSRALDVTPDTVRDQIKSWSQKHNVVGAYVAGLFNELYPNHGGYGHSTVEVDTLNAFFLALQKKVNESKAGQTA